MEQSLKSNSNHRDHLECPACGYHDKGRFCSECGSLLKNYEISFSYVAQLVIEWEDKVTSTTKELLFRPIQFIESYLKGNRTKSAVPLKYFFFCFGIYCFIYGIFSLDSLYVDHMEMAADEMFQLKSDQALESIMGKFGKFFIILLIPIYAGLATIFFPKSTYNFAEKATAVTFLLGLLMAVEAGLGLATALFNPIHLIKNYIVILGELYIFILLAYRFYKVSLFTAIWKSTAMLAITFLCMKYSVMLLDIILQSYYQI